MDEGYYVLVDGNYDFHFNQNDTERIDQTTLSEEKIHLLQNKKSFSIELLKKDFLKKNYMVKVNGNTFRVSVKTPLDQQIKRMGLSIGSMSVVDAVRAPMPGVILEVNVSEGMEVKKGDFLCVLEAMKMENTLTAPRDGKVKAVNVAKGETVDKGKLLIEFKKND